MVVGKPMLNNRITYQNSYGRLNQHDEWLDQSLLMIASPTFNNLQLTGDAYIEGNLYVDGNTTLVNSNIIQFVDNIILINNLETGPGVTLNQSGFEVDRGTLENFRFVYDETDAVFKVGLISDLEPVALREDSPLNDGIMTWDLANKRIYSTNDILISINFSSTENAIDTSSGSVSIDGGLSVKKDIFIDGKMSFQGTSSLNVSTITTSTVNNSLTIVSPQDIFLTPTATTVQLPYNKSISFGSGSQYMSSSTSGNLVIGASGDINLTATRVFVPNQTPIIFSTIDEKIVTDSSNNMIIQGSKDLLLNITSLQKILIPVNTKLAFNTVDQNILGDSSGNISISSTNDIILTPANARNVLIPVNIGVKFGDSGTQKILSDNTNLNISSTNDINLTSVNVNLSTGSKLILGTSTQNIYSDSIGNLFINSSDKINSSKLYVFNSDDSISSTSGGIYTLGGLGVTKTIYTEKGLVIDSEEASSLLVKNNSGTILEINSSTPLFSLTCKSIFENTTESTDLSTASTVFNGGVSIQKKLDVGNSINMNSTKITNLLDPVDDQDAATKAYVDLVKLGLDVKDSVDVATTTQQNLVSDFTPGSLIDSFEITTGNRILIKNQADPTENGIYLSTNGNISRAEDFNTGDSVSGAFTFVKSGTINGNLGWICNSQEPNDIVGTDDIFFTQFTALGQVVAGDGLSKSFNELSVNVDDSSLEISSDALRIKSSAVSTGLTGGSGIPLETKSDQSHVSKLGTIDTGVWNASTINVQYGGTGRDRFTTGTLLFGNGQSGILSDNNLFFNQSSVYLGIGTSSPSSTLHINNTTATLFIESDTSSPSITLKQDSFAISSISIISANDDIVSGSLADALLIYNAKTEGNSVIQFGTNERIILTMTSSGNVGINTTSPTYTLDISGTGHFTERLYISNTDVTNSTNSGALIIDGGVTIVCSQNSSSVTNGGAFFVGGGASILKDLYIGGDVFGSSSNVTFEHITVTSTDAVINSTTASLIVNGGVSIKSSSDSTGLSAGGALLIQGGATVNKSLFVGTNLYSLGDTELSGKTIMSGNTLHQTINNTSGSRQWYYLGELNQSNGKGYCELNIIGNSVDDTDGIKLSLNVNDTVANISHLHYGNYEFDSVFRPNCHVYTDTNGNYQLFSQLPANSSVNIDVLASNLQLQLNLEGTGATPDGTISGFDSWTSAYSTSKESTLKYSFGSVNLEGSEVLIQDSLPVIGYNNSLTSGTRDLGILYQRYQKSNDSSLGDVVTDSVKFSDTLPDQTAVSINQIKFSASASASDDFYNGWWLKVTSGSSGNQVRQITDYNGAQKVATLNNDFTTYHPFLADTVELFNNNFVVQYYSETDKTINMVYSTLDPSNGIIVNNSQFIDLKLNKLNSVDTTVSINGSTGSVNLLGSVSISNTANSVSSTEGGTFTTLGGVAINKNARVGNNISIGGGNFTSIESLYINQNNSTFRLESANTAYNYIDFVEKSSNNRYGILHENSSLYFTSNTIGNTPNLASVALTISSNGNVGVNCTENISSALVLKNNQYISTNSSTGFLGLLGEIGTTLNTAKVILNSNFDSGNLDLYSGQSNGSINFYSNGVNSVEIDNFGRVYFNNTENSLDSTTGSVQISGGVTLSSSQNATSVTSGGTITNMGGQSIAKDLYVGGDVFVDGVISVGGTVTNPTIVFSNETNCSVGSHYNSNLITISTAGVCIFAVEVDPTNASQNCQFEFDLPSRISNLIERGDVVISVSGYTDDTELIPVFNIIGVGVTGTIRALVKFQSVSTSTHFFTVKSTYIFEQLV